MNDYPDNELIGMVCENNEDASNILYNKYKYIVTYTISKYMAKARSIGVDYEELKQEALVGFSDALASFNQDKDAALKTFITLCVERRVNNYIKRMDTTKEKINKETVSLDMEIDEDNHKLYDMLPEIGSDPATKLEEAETIDRILNKATKVLSEQEYEVLELLLEGNDNESISKILNIPIKSVYNYVFRIRNKLKDN